MKSWGWYYPHHYAPYISDVQNFSNLKLEFDLGTPFLPFEQLLAVLPAASRSHLPTAYHNLMTTDESSVIDFYPKDFDTDMNGKKQEWEAVVLIPFIDEVKIEKNSIKNLVKMKFVFRNVYCSQWTSVKVNCLVQKLDATFMDLCIVTNFQL